MIFNNYAQIVSKIPCRYFVLCKVACKIKHSDSLVLVSEFLVVIILSVSEWWLIDSKFVIRIHCLSLESHCTMIRMSTIESYYPFTYMYSILLSLWGISLKMLHSTHVIKEHAK